MDNGWDEWGKHVLAELSRLNDLCEGVMSGNQKIREDLAGLRVKAGYWGVVGGSIPVVVLVAWIIIKG